MLRVKEDTGKAIGLMDMEKKKELDTLQVQEHRNY